MRSYLVKYILEHNHNFTVITAYSLLYPPELDFSLPNKMPPHYCKGISDRKPLNIIAGPINELYTYGPHNRAITRKQFCAQI